MARAVKKTAVAEVIDGQFDEVGEDAFTLVLRDAPTDLVTTMREAFGPFLRQVSEWESKAAGIVVTDAAQVSTIALARQSRLGLRSVRIAIEKARVELKASALKRGQLVDGCAAMLRERLEPIEAQLLEQEQYAERAEAARKLALGQKRRAELSAIGVLVAAIYPGATLDEMTEGVFVQVREDAVLAAQARVEAAARAEADRVAKEKADAAAAEQRRVEAERLEADRQERERAQAAENERLRQAQAKLELDARAERDRVEAERAEERRQAEAEAAERQREADERARVEREARERVEAGLRAEAEAAAARQREADEEAARARAALEAIEAERRAEQERARQAESQRREAEEREAREKADAEARAAAAPDAIKLAAWAHTLPVLPEMATDAGRALAVECAELREKLVLWTLSRAAKLTGGAA